MIVILFVWSIFFWFSRCNNTCKIVKISIAITLLIILFHFFCVLTKSMLTILTIQQIHRVIQNHWNVLTNDIGIYSSIVVISFILKILCPINRLKIYFIYMIKKHSSFSYSTLICVVIRQDFCTINYWKMYFFVEAFSFWLIVQLYLKVSHKKIHQSCFNDDF